MRIRPHLPTNIVDFRGFDSSIMLFVRGGIPRHIGDFPESLNHAILVGCNVSREIGRTASCQKFNLEKWAQPLGDLRTKRA